MFATLSFWVWVASAALAALYAAAGGFKGFKSKEDLAKSLPYTSDLPFGLVRFIGYSELAGALGLILPALTGILPGLTPLAALGLVLIQVLAILFHLRRSEFSVLPMNIVLLALAAFVLWARLGL